MLWKPKNFPIFLITKMLFFKLNRTKLPRENIPRMSMDQYHPFLSYDGYKRRGCASDWVMDLADKGLSKLKYLLSFCAHHTSKRLMVYLIGKPSQFLWLPHWDAMPVTCGMWAYISWRWQLWWDHACWKYYSRWICLVWGDHIPTFNFYYLS